MKKKLSLVASCFILALIMYSSSITINAASLNVSGYISADMSDPKVNDGFTVSLNGLSGTVTTITDENGYFSFSSGVVGDTCTLKISKSNCLTRTIADLNVSSTLVLSTAAEPIEMWLGDLPVNGSQSDSINLADVIEIAKSFSTVLGDSKYSANSDLNSDGSINIADIILLAKHFNKISSDYPELKLPSSIPSTPTPVSAPLLNILPEFTASNVPAMGPEEIKIDSGYWSASSSSTTFPGGGISRYPMLYIGEGYNKIFLVDKGKVIWTYSTGQGEELDDIWMMTNGNILYTRQSYVAEVNPQKKEVWRYKAPGGSEIHSAQPIGLDKVLMAINANPPKLVIVNKTTGKVEMEHILPHEKPEDVHGQFRRVRITDKGTYLVSYLSVGKIVEFDKDFKQIWSYQIRSPWASIRLKNGNTLISSEKLGLIREVSNAGETVWEFKLSELPSEYNIPDSQSCVRLDNGNIIICSRGNSGNNPQLIEITPDKKVEWALKDWKNLGPATAVQILSDPGIPENPGECQR